MSLLADRSPKSVAGRTEFRKLWQTGTVRGANNALDEAEEAGVAPEIDIQVEGTKIIYSIRVSSPRGLCQPNARSARQRLKDNPVYGICSEREVG
jgi:hypothetical protein